MVGGLQLATDGVEDGGGNGGGGVVKGVAASPVVAGWKGGRGMSEATSEGVRGAIEASAREGQREKALLFLRIVYWQPFSKLAFNHCV